MGVVVAVIVVILTPIPCVVPGMVVLPGNVHKEVGQYRLAEDNPHAVGLLIVPGAFLARLIYHGVLVVIVMMKTVAAVVPAALRPDPLPYKLPQTDPR